MAYVAGSYSARYTAHRNGYAVTMLPTHAASESAHAGWLPPGHGSQLPRSTSPSRTDPSALLKQMITASKTGGKEAALAIAAAAYGGHAHQQPPHQVGRATGSRTAPPPGVPMLRLHTALPQRQQHQPMQYTSMSFPSHANVYGHDAYSSGQIYHAGSPPHSSSEQPSWRVHHSSTSPSVTSSPPQQYPSATQHRRSISGSDMIEVDSSMTTAILELQRLTHSLDHDNGSINDTFKLRDSSKSASSSSFASKSGGFSSAQSHDERVGFAPAASASSPRQSGARVASSTSASNGVRSQTPPRPTSFKPTTARLDSPTAAARNKSHGVSSSSSSSSSPGGVIELSARPPSRSPPPPKPGGSDEEETFDRDRAAAPVAAPSSQLQASSSTAWQVPKPVVRMVHMQQHSPSTDSEQQHHHGAAIEHPAADGSVSKVAGVSSGSTLDRVKPVERTAPSGSVQIRFTHGPATSATVVSAPLSAEETAVEPATAERADPGRDSRAVHNHVDNRIAATAAVGLADQHSDLGGGLRPSAASSVDDTCATPAAADIEAAASSSAAHASASSGPVLSTVAGTSELAASELAVHLAVQLSAEQDRSANLEREVRQLRTELASTKDQLAHEKERCEEQETSFRTLQSGNSNNISALQSALATLSLQTSKRDRYAGVSTGDALIDNVMRDLLDDLDRSNETSAALLAYTTSLEDMCNVQKERIHELESEVAEIHVQLAGSHAAAAVAATTIAGQFQSPMGMATMGTAGVIGNTNIGGIGDLGQIHGLAFAPPPFSLALQSPSSTPMMPFVSAHQLPHPVQAPSPTLTASTRFEL